jgi:hypothetical protein
MADSLRVPAVQWKLQIVSLFYTQKVWGYDSVFRLQKIVCHFQFAEIHSDSCFRNRNVLKRAERH